MEMSGQLNTPADLLRGKSHQYLIGGGLGPTACLDVLEKRNVWLTFSLDVILRTGVHKSCERGRPED